MEPTNLVGRPPFAGRISYDASAVCGQCEKAIVGLQVRRPSDDLLAAGWRRTSQLGWLCPSCAGAQGLGSLTVPKRAKGVGDAR